MGFWDIFKGRPNVLDGITAPTKVDVRGIVRSKERLNSPLTDFPGVYFGWHFFSCFTDDNGTEHWTHLRATSFGAPIEIAVGNHTLLLPSDPRIQMELRAPSSGGQVLQRALPPGYPDLGNITGSVWVHETPFGHGHAIRVRGTVVPNGSRFTLDLQAEAALIDDPS